MKKLIIKVRWGERKQQWLHTNIMIKIKFMLPAGYLFSKDEDDEGNEVVNITAGEYENDEGETCYKFTCRVSYTEYDPEEADEEFTSDNLLDLLAERMEDSRRMKLPGTLKRFSLTKVCLFLFLGMS